MTVGIFSALGQSARGSVQGVVLDAQKRSVPGAKVWLDDQLAGRAESATTDGAGRYEFREIPASTYMLRAQKPGFAETTHGPFALKPAEAASINLQLTDAKSAVADKSAAQTMEYSDEPNFTVAGVSDPSNVGGHGSNVTLPTKEALARDTASLAGESSGPKTGAHPEEIGKVTPNVPAEDYGQNLRVGRALLQAGRAKEAAGYLQQAASLKPQDCDTGYLLALAYLRSGNSKAAEATVTSVLATQDRADLHALLGEVREAEGQPVDAVKEYQRAAEMDPSEAHLFAWGAELLLHRAYQPATEVFDKGHRLHPSSIRMLVGLGAAAYAQDLNDQAARWLLQASDLDPKDPRPYLFLGKVQEVAKSEPKEWVAVFERFATLRPDNAEANYYYAVALEKQRRGEEDYAARDAHLRKAIALDPKFGDAYLELGLLQAEKREYAKAVESLQTAVKLTPLPDEAHLRLAQVYREMGDTQKARQESELYNQAAEKKKAQLDKERRELGQFVFTMQGKPATAEPQPAKP